MKALVICRWKTLLNDDEETTLPDYSFMSFLFAYKYGLNFITATKDLLWKLHVHDNSWKMQNSIKNFIKKFHVSKGIWLENLISRKGFQLQKFQ